MRKMISQILCMVSVAALAVTGLAGCTGGTKVTDGNYPVTAKFVKPLGRYAIDADFRDTMWLSLSATGIEFAYENCTKCSLDLTADGMSGPMGEKMHQPRYAIYVNDELVKDDQIKTQLETVEVPLTEKSGVVRLVKLSESSDSTMGVYGIHVDGTIKPTAKKDLKIEFIGDSITCGYGVDGTMEDTYCTGNENATKSFAYKTAQKLNADYSMVSYSGHGIISGWTNDPNQKITNQLVPELYLGIGNSYKDLPSGKKAKEIMWDFGKFQPNYVVINLGTNDASYCNTQEKRDEYSTQYVEFLKLIRSKNPKATIICTLGVMGQDLCEAMHKAVLTYQSETNDQKVHYMDFDVQTDGYVVDYHPTETTHEKASDKLVEFIQGLEK